MPVSFHNTRVADINIFHREAGDSQAPAVLLLHGFPTSSHMFRNLIPELAAKYRVVAPDLPGFGFSDAPDHKSFAYTFSQEIRSFLDGVYGQLRKNKSC